MTLVEALVWDLEELSPLVMVSVEGLPLLVLVDSNPAAEMSVITSDAII